MNPLPAAVVGIGLCWLFRGCQPNGYVPANYGNAGNRFSDVASGAQSLVGAAVGKVSDVADQAQEAAGNIVHAVQDKTSQAASNMQSAVGGAVDQMQSTAHHGGDWLQRTLQDTPLVIGSMALALGLAVGLAIPETAPEHQPMGQAKDNLLDKAQGAVQDFTGKIQSVANDAMSTVTESAQKAGVTA